MRAAICAGIRRVELECDGAVADVRGVDLGAAGRVGRRSPGARCVSLGVPPMVA